MHTAASSGGAGTGGLPGRWHLGFLRSSPLSPATARQGAGGGNLYLAIYSFATLAWTVQPQLFGQPMAILSFSGQNYMVVGGIFDAALCTLGMVIIVFILVLSLAVCGLSMCQVCL
jgi:hypothetical protein